MSVESEPTSASAGSGNDEYRYERVTMGLLMGDFRFRKNTLSAGDPFPQFDLPTTDGQRIRKDDYVGKRPLLVVFGSKSCPLTVSSMEPLKQLHGELGHDIEFVTVNVREAHPGENFKQPMNYERKLEHARDLQTYYDVPWIIAVDDIDGTLHRALDAKPNAAYLMDKSGNIAFRTLFAGDDAALGQALRSVSQGRPPPKMESSAMLKPMALAIGFIERILKEAGPQAQRDMIRVAPPLILAAKVAGLFQFMAEPHRGTAALVSIVVVIAAIAVGAIGVFI